MTSRCSRASLATHSQPPSVPARQRATPTSQRRRIRAPPSKEEARFQEHIQPNQKLHGPCAISPVPPLSSPSRASHQPSIHLPALGLHSLPRPAWSTLKPWKLLDTYSWASAAPFTGHLHARYSTPCRSARTTCIHFSISRGRPRHPNFRCDLFLFSSQLDKLSVLSHGSLGLRYMLKQALIMHAPSPVTPTCRHITNIVPRIILLVKSNLRCDRP